METFQKFISRNSPPKDCHVLFRFENITLTDIIPDLEWLPCQISVLNSRIELFIAEFNEIGSSDRLNDVEKDCQTILDWSWERLNVGVWSNVDVNYRLLLAYHRFLEAVLRCIRYQVSNDTCILDALLSILEPLDLALIMSPDLPLSNCSLTKVANSFHEDYIIKYLLDNKTNANEEYKLKFQALSDRLEHDRSKNWNVPVPKMKISNSIPRIEHSFLDILEFECNYLRKNVALIIAGAIENWPCFSKQTNNQPSTLNRLWSFETLLNRMAFRTVPIEIGSSYTDNNWSQKLIKFIDFVEQYVSAYTDVIGYLAQYALFQQIPELSSDFAIPDYCAASRLPLDQEDDDGSEPANVDINVWIGPAGTVSPLHTDPRDNIFVQVCGRKYIRLISSEVSPEQLYPFDGLQSNTSQVNIELPDAKLHPNFFDIDPSFVRETIIQPGEMLYIPRGCWHFVKSLEPSISLSFWFN